jgi:hypothetical protein
MPGFFVARIAGSENMFRFCAFATDVRGEGSDALEFAE